MAEKLPSSFYCSICNKLFDSALNAPKFLICHHKICHCCCVNRVSNGLITCPFCRSFTSPVREPGEVTFHASVARLTTDHDVLSLLLTFKSMKNGHLAGKKSASFKKDYSSSDSESDSEGTFKKNVFLTSEADKFEFPLGTEHSAMKSAGLGLRFDISFNESGSSFYIKDKLMKAFPRLIEVDNFYFCTWPPGDSCELKIEYYDVPSAHALNMIPDQLIVLVPVQRTLPYQLGEGTVTCDKCRRVMNVRLWAQHIHSECNNPREGCSGGPPQ